MTPFKTFLIISIILTAIALVITYTAINQASSIHPATIATPYVDVEGVSVSGEGLVVKLVVINATGNVTITGGYAEILETSQSATLTVTGPTTLEARYTLLPQYINTSTIGIRGLVSGYFYGDPMYIGFFVVSPIHVSISIQVNNVYYSNCTLDLSLKYSTPIPIVINDLVNATLVDDTESTYVFYVLGSVPIDTVVGPGVGTVNYTLYIPSIINTRAFTCSLINGHTYTLYLPMILTYEYPTTNITDKVTLYRVFVWGG